MAPIDLNHVRAFVAVYELGSFSRAATRLGVPRSTVSRSLSSLERALKIDLFHRTTRSVQATEEAKSLYDRVQGSLTGLETALVEAPRKQETPSGTLRLTATNDIGLSLLAEAVTRFVARFPEVECEVNLAPRVVDLVRERFDLGVRIASKPLHNSSTLIARKLGLIRAEYYASPGYLARKGTPRSVEELEGHEHISFRGGPNQPIMNTLPARILCDDTLYARELARHGAGIAALPTFITAEDVASGALVRLLPDQTEFTGTVWLVHPRAKILPARVTAFRDLLLELLRQRPLLQ